MFLFVFWLRNRPSTKYVHNWGNLMFFSNAVLFYLQKFKFAFTQKRVFVRNGCFSPMGPISVLMKYAFF